MDEATIQKILGRIELLETRSEAQARQLEAQAKQIRTLTGENTIVKASIAQLVRKLDVANDSRERQEQRIAALERSHELLQRHVDEQAQEHLEQLKQVL